MATISVNELAIGNIFAILFVGMILYLLFEYPFRRLLQWSVLPSLSYDKIKHAYFVDLFAKIKERMGSFAEMDKGGSAPSDLSMSKQDSSM